MQVIEIEKFLPYCENCKNMEKDEIEIAQKVALFFTTETLERRKGSGFKHVGVMGTVKSIRKDDDQKIYSIIFENGTLSEIIVSSIKNIVLVCDECAIKYHAKEH